MDRNIQISKKLRKFIDKRKAIPLSDREVMELVNRKAKVVMYKDLHKIRDIDELFGNQNSIFLFINQTLSFGHWCVLLRQPQTKTYSFFDSYGGYPDSQLKWTSPAMRRQLNMEEPHLTRILETAPADWHLTYNKIKYQKDRSDVQSCGRFCAARVLMHKFTDSEFADYFHRKGKGVDSDDLVTMLTMFQLDKKLKKKQVL